MGTGQPYLTGNHLWIQPGALSSYISHAMGYVHGTFLATVVLLHAVVIHNKNYFRLYHIFNVS